MSTVFALVDANSFYVSCEKLFRADLEGKPVVVVGNGDHCIVARSNEAKRLGLKMGAPIFQCQKLIEQHSVLIFSSNYALYQDISNRVMRCLAHFSPRQEIYSIDESWLDLSHVPDQELVDYSLHLRATVLKLTGIPVSIGIGATKVLSKVACELVKRLPSTQQVGVCNLLRKPEQEVDRLLDTIAVGDIWGIGRGRSTRLEKKGVFTAKDLKEADHVWIRCFLGVAAQRIVLELRGISCIPLEMVPKPKQGIMTALSFGRPITDLGELEEAVATYTVRCAEKLRKEQSKASRISVFIQTNLFDETAPQYVAEDGMRLPFATSFTPDFLDAALNLVRLIYKPGYSYKRAGVFLSEIGTEQVRQADLFGVYNHEVANSQQDLMMVVDRINRVFGRDTIFFGAQGIGREWFMQQKRLSSRATTRWSEILTVSG